MNANLPAVHEIWVYLSGSPLFALILTLAAYQLGILAYERSGRSPLANPVAITTGILGAIVARYILNAVGSTAWWQRGFALGIAAHGIGTARAFSVNDEAGRYASLAMGLHGILGAVLIPLLAH